MPYCTRCGGELKTGAYQCKRCAPAVATGNPLMAVGTLLVIAAIFASVAARPIQTVIDMGIAAGVAADLVKFGGMALGGLGLALVVSAGALERAPF